MTNRFSANSKLQNILLGLPRHNKMGIISTPPALISKYAQWCLKVGITLSDLSDYVATPGRRNGCYEFDDQRSRYIDNKNRKFVRAVIDAANAGRIKLSECI